jgi:hypothetical protein
MQLPVIFIDGTPRSVNTKHLDVLIQTNSLLSFKRSSGWVRVNVDELRNPDRNSLYNGAERRNNYNQ